MRSLITGILVAIALAFVFALVLNSIQQSAEMAFATEGARLDAASILSAKVDTQMTDPLIVGAIIGGVLAIVGTIIGAAIGAAAVYFATRAQIKALRDQSEEERMRFQQSRHQKKYEIALALQSEACRLARSAQERIPVAQASRDGSEHPWREQMTILAINRGEREDIGLLSDDLQDEVRDLVNKVDDYNSHLEALRQRPGGPIGVDRDGQEKLIHLRDKAQSAAQKFNGFIVKVREWRCTRCGAFIDEILDKTENGQRIRCPVCSDTTRTIGARAVL
jgi:hypothetical protein